MSLHPALAAVVAADLLASAAAAWAIAGALRVAAGWSPGAATAEQLSVERKAEEVSIAGRTALALALPGTLLLLVAINHVLPPLVPGAMCGMGVLDAMPDGRATLGLRVTALAALFAWGTLDALDRRDRFGPLAPRAARGILAAGGLLLASTLRTTSSLLDLDVHAPVSCCAATLDLARAASGPRTAWLAGPWHALVLVAAGLLLAASACGEVGDDATRPKPGRIKTRSRALSTGDASADPSMPARTPPTAPRTSPLHRHRLHVGHHALDLGAREL